MARCLITRELPGSAADGLTGAGHEVEVRRERMPPTHEQLLQIAPRFDALLTLLTDSVDAELIAAAPDLRAIANYAVGTDNIDLEAATARGIPVGNTPDVLTETTADLALALMLAMMRRLREGEDEVRAGEWVTWEPARLLGHDLHSATVLVIGAGRIGRAVSQRLEGFGCRVLTAGRGDSLDAPLREADVVTLHCPLTPATRGLIAAGELAAMKPTAYLVNTARGPIVDSGALLAALHEGQIAGAALDVTDPEPLPSDHPLMGAPGLLVVPHVASATHATREAMAQMAVDNLLAALAGKRMPHCANPEVYET